MSRINRIKETTELINLAMDALLPDGSMGSVAMAVRYCVTGGGKRIRPLLLLAAYEAAGGEPVTDIDEPAMRFACAMEMIHTYSLVHDDLPAMDNDDLRRGHPTCHKQFGEATAILTGDALLNLAFETIAESLMRFPANSPAQIGAFSYIVNASGFYGMIGGQELDMLYEGMSPDRDMLDLMYLKKTGELIKAAICAGATLAGADAGLTLELSMAASKLGLAFQIQDDVLDVLGTSEQLGKPQFSDEKNNKSTYVDLFGAEVASAMAADLISDVIAELKDITIPGKSDLLFSIIDLVAFRKA